MGTLILPDAKWNATDTAYPDDLLIHQLFEQQVIKTPDAIGLIDGPRHYTYAEMNMLTNRLARTLRERGVGNESVVGCHLTRSAAIVFCTLATLKAGGAYVLFDASMPILRLEYIIRDAKPSIVLTDTQFPNISVGSELKTAIFSDLEHECQSHDSSNLENTISNSSAAYIAYTSGSTGLPKGVIITHKSTANHGYAFRKAFLLGQSDRVPLMAPIAFDMAIEEMVPPLLSGCTLIVSSPGFSSIADFHHEVVGNAYTILNLPAPLWHEWSEYMAAHDRAIPPSLRLVITGSEEIETKSYAKWKSLDGADSVAWVAAYGTTETTVTSTFYTGASHDDLTGEPFIPIGKPIANTYVYILDDNLQPVGVGEEGELYIGGQGVARGYLHHAELTKQRFIPDPFRSDANVKMYKTGDVARYRPDGNAVWLGRSDFQFKIKGLRIEPEEIEAVLNTSPAVEESVVILQRSDGSRTQKRLVAFVTASAGHHFDEDELRTVASAHLPHLMVPQKFVLLPTLPLNLSGKIDRGALENF